MEVVIDVIGDVPSEADGWLRDNDITSITTFKWRFLSKIDYLNILDHNTIESIKHYVRNIYNIRYNDQILLFKGQETNDSQSVLSLMLTMTDQCEPLSDDFGLDLVVVKKPYTLHVDNFHDQPIEFDMKIQDSDTIGKIKEKIANGQGLPVQYIKLYSANDETMTLEDDSKTVEECGLGLHPIIWMKPVVLIHVTFLGLTPDLRFSRYETLEKHTTLDDILLKIRDIHKVKGNQLMEVFDRTFKFNYWFSEIQIKIHQPPAKRQCIVM